MGINPVELYTHGVATILSTSNPYITYPNLKLSIKTKNKGLKGAMWVNRPGPENIGIIKQAEYLNLNNLNLKPTSICQNVKRWSLSF